jgi:AcrR family transcriptional regulator
MSAGAAAEAPEEYEPDQECEPYQHRTRQRPTGLRERKKLATRQALGSAAMRLAIERGLDNVLVEDIAAAANVSARTFNNYFASKYEAICALMVDRSYRIGDELRARPEGEGLWEAIRAAVLTVYAASNTAPDPETMAGIRLVTSSPVLRGEYLKAMAVAQYGLAEAITERTGGQAGADSFFTRSLAGAVTSALQAASERWLFGEPPMPMAPIAEAALDHVAQGMAELFGPSGRCTSGPESPAPAPENGAPSTPSTS